MFRRFIPREEGFFTLFSASAELIVEGAKGFKTLSTDLARAELHCRNIKDLEHKADDVTHRTVELLHKTFITPIDREDIHLLITKMDDIIDLIEAASERILLYGITHVPPELQALVDICIAACEKLKIAVDKLDNLKRPDELLKLCVEINRLENEGDNALRIAIARLFREESDTRQLIKLKELYELLESATDRCEDVANIIEGIVLEYA